MAKRSKRPPGRRSSGRGEARFAPDPSDADDAEVRFVQPYQATKAYRCPGCHGEIPPGVGHMVVVPAADPDLRRHWHRGCWVHRANRR